MTYAFLGETLQLRITRTPIGNLTYCVESKDISGVNDTLVLSILKTFEYIGDTHGTRRRLLTA